MHVPLDEGKGSGEAEGGATKRRGLAGALPFGPSDLIDALAVDLFGAQCQIQLLADHSAHEIRGPCAAAS